jgi:hypothetical protein
VTLSRAFALLLCISSVWGQEDPREEEAPEARPDRDMLSFKEETIRMREAIEEGLAYLARQQRGDGSVGRRDYRIAVTALAGLAFMAGGSTVTTGPYAPQVRRAVEFYLDLRGHQESEEWWIAASDDRSRLHGHGFATLFLAEALGTCGVWERREELGLRLHEAVQLIVKSQEPRGGWGYTPYDPFHEGSITVTQLQALRAARDAGLDVPQGVINRALGYLEASKVERPTWAFFRYRLDVPSMPSFPLAAAAVSSLNAVGKYRTRTVDLGLAFLRRYIPGVPSQQKSRDERFGQFWYYGQLYAVQAMFQSGGRDWEIWFPAIRDRLVRLQAGDGSWGREASESLYGYAYPTAVACIILQVPHRLLPILCR